jgi:tellurite methyltransferase
MPISDAHRWNERYQQDIFKTPGSPRSFLVQNAGYLPEQGLVLDVAMGRGNNTGFLIERGLKVVGVDISEVAVSCAKGRFPALMAFVADLAHFYIPQRFFDLIINFYYLQRDLWPVYRRALRPGGILVFESLTLDMLEQSPDIDPKYLLAPGELQRGFQDMHILVYREGWILDDRGHPRAVASLVARKIDFENAVHTTGARVDKK